MKIRLDYVTNSSSSSFIMFSKCAKAIPEKYRDVIEELNTESSILNVLADSDLFEREEPLLKEHFGFTDSQIDALKALFCDNLELYAAACDALKAGNSIYYIYVDRDWFFDQTELKEFISSCDSYIDLGE